MLIGPARRLRLLHQSGADRAAILNVSPTLLQMSARTFFERVLIDQFQILGLVEGENFAFGKDRAGTVQQLADWCRSSAVRFEAVPLTADDQLTVSSSRVRDLVRAGDVSQATSLMGRPHRLEGTVIAGAGRGRKLGFPTCNLQQIEVLIPATGVYAGRAWLPDGSHYPAACNIGGNPTFGEQSQKVEIHLIGFQGDLYGQPLAVDLLAKIREVLEFDSLPSLVAQIASDVARSTEILARTPVPTTADELLRTIEEWVLLESSAVLRCHETRLIHARWSTNNQLELGWRMPAQPPGPILFDLLFHLEGRLMRAFPEVRAVSSSSTP